MKRYLTKVRMLAMVLCAVLCLNTSVNVMQVSATGVDVAEAAGATEVVTEEVQVAADATTVEVIIDANGGTFNVTATDGTEYLWQTGLYTATVSVGATLFEAGARPTQLTNGDKRFVGWSVWEKDETGSYVDAGMGYLLSPNMETYTISGRDTKFVAEWVEPGTATVQINCYDGSFSLTRAGETTQTDSFFGTYEAGKTLAECGISLSAAVNADGKTGFEGWEVYYMVDDMMFPYNVYTVETLSEFELPVGAVFIIPRWEPPLYVTVEFNGNGGSFDFTMNGEAGESSYYTTSLEEGKTIAECGITLTDPVHEDSKIPFLYWTVCRLDEMGMAQISLGNYTTKELMNYVIPDDSISIYAQWDYPMDCRVRVKAYGGSFQMTADGATTEADSFAMTLSEGENLGECGVSIGTPVYSEEGTQFSHWSIRQWDADTETYSFVGEYTTEEMLAYPINEDNTEFYAQWSGDKDAYYGNVCIDGNGATFNLIIEDENLWQTNSYVSTFGVDSCLFDYDFGISQLTNGDKCFIGWSLLEMDESGNYVNVGYYDSTNVRRYTITDKSVKFVAQWLEPGTAKVEISCYDGTFSITENGETREVSSYSNTLEAGKTLAECGISLLNAVNEDGEAVFEWYVDTMVGDMLGAPNWYTLEELLNYPLPVAAVIIRPCWEVNVEINGNGGSFDLTGYDGTPVSDNSYTCRMQEGISLAECGVSITDPVFPDGETQFSHWSIRKWDYETETYSFVGEYTTEEMLACPMSFSLTDSNNIMFYAQWKSGEPAPKKPVFEGLSVSYDAEQNVIEFVLNGYDEDSADWQYNICLSDEKGNRYYIYSYHISENPYKTMYSADELPNGTYIVEYVDMFDAEGNYGTSNFESGDYTVEVTNSPYESTMQVRAFVERMYTVALGRTADQSGVDYWTKQLLTHAADGAAVSRGFILEEEFAGKNYSNKEFVTILYSTFFDRAADEGGKNYWSSVLESGATRASVLAGFVNSNEFLALCNSFGISRGVLRGDGSAINPGIYQFSERLYSEILERQGDKDGIEYWTVQLDEGATTPEQAAASFFLGGEYLSRNTTNEQYVQALYRTFMGREADADGLGYWKGVLESGMDRMTVLWALAGCPEFQTIKQQYGL